MKRAQVPINLLIGFVLAFVLLSIVFLLVMILTIAPGFTGVDIGLKVKLNATSTSRVCNHDLINFLRATDSESGLEFGQLLALNSIEFQSRAEEYFNNSFKRGDSRREGWMLVVLTQNLEPVTTTGTLDTMPIKESCTQHVPGLTPSEYFIVKLGTEY